MCLSELVAFPFAVLVCWGVCDRRVSDRDVAGYLQLMRETVAGEATAGHAILYRTSVLTFEGQGQMQLNEMDQWGPVGEFSYNSFFFLILTEDHRVCTLYP